MEKGCGNFFYHRSRNIAMGAVVLREETDNVGGSVGGMQDPRKPPVPCGRGANRRRARASPPSVFLSSFPCPASLPSCYIPPASLPVSARVLGLRADCMPRLHAHGRSGDNTEAE